MKILKITTAILLLSGTANVAQSETFSSDIWVDNWFALYINENLVKEDSVSIDTERSFNKESFSFEAERPFVLNLVIKDFKENDTGLEYIDRFFKKQQMGDGGAIAQFKDANGQLVAATNNQWRCMVTHKAPLDKSCAKENSPVAGKAPCTFIKTAQPTAWQNFNFDDSNWPNAVEYATNQVRPKDGYDQVSWHPNAKLIWGGDLETDNTLLCRFKLQ